MNIPDPSDIISTNNLLIDMIDHLHTLNVKIEPNQKFLEIQCVKYAFHTSTLLDLFNGTKIQKVKFPDYNSILLLLRAQLEAYLMFYYLNVDIISREERELRMLLFEASGLNHRQKFKVSTPENQQKLNDESILLESLKTRIATNSYFQNLTSKRRVDLLKSVPARMFGWVELIKRSNLRSELFVDIWSLCSNYAHSEYLSLMQFKGYISNNQELTRSLTQVLRQSIILTAVICYDLLALFPQLVPFYNEKAAENLDRLAELNDMGREIPFTEKGK
jgi:hypothetical protein